MSIAILFGVFFIGVLCGVFLYSAYILKCRKNSKSLQHFSPKVKNTKDIQKPLLEFLQEQLLKSSPFQMLWCIVDSHKKIVLTHEAFLQRARVYQPAYALQLFRSTEVENRIEYVLHEKKPEYVWNVSFLEAQWDIHIIPFICNDVSTDDIRLEKYSRSDESFAFVTCMPTTKNRSHESDEIEEEFLQNVAHEIKNPLTAIIGFAELLHKDMQNQSTVERIQRQSKRLFSIVENIALLTQHSDDAHFDKISIYNCVTDAMEQLEDQAQLRQVCLECRLHETEILSVMGNATLLTIAYKNVLENAIKHSKSHDSVIVQSAIRNLENKCYTIICITDRGEGIASVDKDKIFDRFYRSNVGKSRAQGGTGLGLAITKKVLDIHGGTVSVESTINKGSVFTISIPSIG